MVGYPGPLRDNIVGVGFDRIRGVRTFAAEDFGAAVATCFGVASELFASPQPASARNGTATTTGTRTFKFPYVTPLLAPPVRRHY